MSGIDGDSKYLESVDKVVRVEGPHNIADEDMKRYLDRIYEANSFVADFFDFVPAIGIRFTVSPDGSRYNWDDLSRPRLDWYARPIEMDFMTNNHPNFDNDGVVHEFTHSWDNKYLPQDAPMHEFWALYLENASIFVRNGGEVKDFLLRDCNRCFGHQAYWDKEGNLIGRDKLWGEEPYTGPYFWAHRKQFDLEQVGWTYRDFKELAERLNDKYRTDHRVLTTEDFEESIRLVRAEKS